MSCLAGVSYVVTPPPPFPCVDLLTVSMDVPSFQSMTSSRAYTLEVK